MAQTIHQAADGSAGITQGIAEVDELATRTAAASDGTVTAADDLARLSARLGDLVSDFRC